MKKYYLIPMTDRSIYLNGKSLKSILNFSHPELGQREEDRISILYSVSPLLEMPKSVEKRYEQHNIETKKLYDKAQVPFYLIAYGNNKNAKEILTKYKITAEYPAALGVRSISQEEAEKYYADTDYETKIRRYFNYIYDTYKSPFNFTDTYEIEGYIEGKVEEQNIKGIFNGKVKIKKLEFKLK